MYIYIQLCVSGSNEGCFVECYYEVFRYSDIVVVDDDVEYSHCQSMLKPWMNWATETVKKTNYFMLNSDHTHKVYG